MPVNFNLAPARPVAGVELVTLNAGLKPEGTTDMVLARLCDSSVTAAVFTQNTFCAAPVTLCKEYLSANGGAVRALLINSGNANAGTGQAGYDMAKGHCQALAQAISVSENAVLPFSTGVIGQLLPDDIMRAGINSAVEQLNQAEQASEIQAWQDAARGIMTTDTLPKLTSQSVQIAGQTVTITGMAKGAGMIEPDMATMLSYIFTDAALSAADLDAALRQAVATSFNAITVDSDTSTNDACVLVATGQSNDGDTVSLSAGHPGWSVFTEALSTLCLDLAQAIIRDAEGATKFITVKVTGGKDIDECRQVAYAVANSPLVKTAMFAGDANVGRLLMAIGKAGVKTMDASKVTVSLGDVVAFEQAGIAASYTEEKGAAVMAKEEIDVTIDLARGDANASVYTSDLSHEYVSINADYRS